MPYVHACTRMGMCAPQHAVSTRDDTRHSTAHDTTPLLHCYSYRQGGRGTPMAEGPLGGGEAGRSALGTGPPRAACAATLGHPHTMCARRITHDPRPEHLSTQHTYRDTLEALALSN
jgi:hypothetical protein